MTDADVAVIAMALGGAKKWGTGWMARCCCHDDHEPSLSLKVGAGHRLLVYCFAGCDGRNILRELRRRGLHQGDERPGVRRVENKLAPDHSKFDYLLSLLQPVEGTPAKTYLSSRGIDLPADGHHLRFLAANPPRHPWPCMAGLITDFTDANRVLSLHLTRLAHDGQSKAPLPKAEQRSVLAGFPIKRGVIRLCGDADVTYRVGLGEGVETALAITTSYRRDEGRFEAVWAALNAGNMAELPVLPGIETLAIYADRDGAGEQAADKLAQRWLAAGCEVIVAIAPNDDWNPSVP